MGFSKWWLTTALCLLAITASQGQDETEPPIIPFDAVNVDDPPAITMNVVNADDPPFVTMNADLGRQSPIVIPDDDEEMDDDDDEDAMDDVEYEEKFLKRDFMETNPREVNGEAVFEADMMLTPNQWRAVRERKGLRYETSRWTEVDGAPLVPFIYKDGRVNTGVIQSAMDHWMEHTCIKFQQTSNTNQPHIQYIYGGGCYSYVGMLSQNGQPVSIGYGCDYLGIVAHEIGHAIGFMHEQSRPDRDSYVIINYDNIQDNAVGNFYKYSTNDIDSKNIEYDYTSDMHYGPTGFSTNGKSTITTKDPLRQGLIGQREGLSHRDKHLANIMYKCIDKWMAQCEIQEDPCQNGGYYGKACACVCPPGTSGDNCEQQTASYFSQYENDCTEEITEEKTISSPNYPGKYPETKCVKVIKAPECHVPRVTFSAFELYSRNPYCSNSNECCYFDALEIRNTDKAYGDVFCGTDITSGRSFTSTNREMVLFFRARTNNYRTGWTGQVTFVKQDGCEVETTPAPTDAPTTTEEPTTPEPTTEEPTTPEPTTVEPTTPEPTTTGEPEPKCLIERYNGVYYWSSPNFGNENYPHSFSCSLRGSAASGTYGLVLKMVDFQLQGKKNKQCVDSVKIKFHDGTEKNLCGKKTGKQFKTASFNFEMVFTSDDAINRRGFNISMTPTTNTCNKVITAEAGEQGKITATRKQRMCEYKIVAPEGSQVRIDQVAPRIQKTEGCTTNYIKLNGNSERMYPTETSKVICGWAKTTTSMVSTTGEMYVAYKAKKKGRGFTLDYSIVQGTY